MVKMFKICLLYMATKRKVISNVDLFSLIVGHPVHSHLSLIFNLSKLACYYAHTQLVQYVLVYLLPNTMLCILTSYFIDEFFVIIFFFLQLYSQVQMLRNESDQYRKQLQVISWNDARSTKLPCLQTSNCFIEYSEWFLISFIIKTKNYYMYTISQGLYVC